MISKPLTTPSSTATHSCLFPGVYTSFGAARRSPSVPCEQADTSAARLLHRRQLSNLHGQFLLPFVSLLEWFTRSVRFTAEKVADKGPQMGSLYASKMRLSAIFSVTVISSGENVF